MIGWEFVCLALFVYFGIAGIFKYSLNRSVSTSIRHRCSLIDVVSFLWPLFITASLLAGVVFFFFGKLTE
jgi:hypothetical protein